MTESFDLHEDEERAIAAFMSRVAELRIPNPPRLRSGQAESPSTALGASPSTSLGASRIPGADQLWWKAQLLRKWEAERRAQWPLDIMQPIEIAGGLVAAGLLVYWSLPYLL